MKSKTYDQQFFVQIARFDFQEKNDFILFFKNNDTYILLRCREFFVLSIRVCK
jgi:hypothetical protein